MRLALEPLNPLYGGNRTCLMTVRDALRVCDMVEAANVGIAVDVYHVWWDTTLHESLMKAGAGRILWTLGGSGTEQVPATSSPDRPSPRSR